MKRQHHHSIFFYWIYSLFTFQILSPFPVSPLPGNPHPIFPPPASMRMLFHPLHSHLPALNSPTLRHLSSLHRTKDLSSHWCLTRQSSATYAAGAMYTLWWFSPWELWGRGRAVGWYCSSSYGVANPFSSFSPFSSSSIGIPVLSTMVGCKHLPLYL